MEAADRPIASFKRTPPCMFFDLSTWSLPKHIIHRSEGRKVKPWVPVVSSIGGLIVGVLVGLVGAYFLQRRLRRRHGGRPDALHRKSSSMSMTTPVMSSPPHEHYRDLPSSDNSRDRCVYPYRRVFTLTEPHDAGCHAIHHIRLNHSCSLLTANSAVERLSRW